jgi:hypothetical protein
LNYGHRHPCRKFGPLAFFICLKRDAIGGHFRWPPRATFLFRNRGGEKRTELKI